MEETGYGNVKDKIAKNLLNADLLPRRMRGMRTIGMLRELPEEGMVEYGVPVGVVAAILPTTNPTSTAIYKTLISLKAGNAVVISPHPTRSALHVRDSRSAVSRRARGRRAGRHHPVPRLRQHGRHECADAARAHRRDPFHGRHGIVRAAYSSGKPAFGVGPGNVPVLMERTADIAEAVAKIIEGKSFDYGTVCSSEQAIVAEEWIEGADDGRTEGRQAHFCNAGAEAGAGKLLVTPNWTINPSASANRRPRSRGWPASNSAGTSILVVDLDGVGKQHPLSMEKLSPVLALYFVKDFAAGMDICDSLLRSAAWVIPA